VRRARQVVAEPALLAPVVGLARLDAPLVHDAVTVVVDPITDLLRPGVDGRIGVIAVRSEAARSVAEPVPVSIDTDVHAAAGRQRRHAVLSPDTVVGIAPIVTAADRVVDQRAGQRTGLTGPLAATDARLQLAEGVRVTVVVVHTGHRAALVDETVAVVVPAVTHLECRADGAEADDVAART